MAIYFVIAICSAWLSYNSVADIFSFPIIMLCPNGHFILRLISSMTLKWSGVFGVLGFFIAVSGYFYGRKADNTVNQLGFVLMVFYLFLSGFLLI